MENNLEIDVKNAKALGLSYGKYKALGFIPNVVPAKKKEKSGKICPVCGEIIKPPRYVVCSDECLYVRKKQRREAKKVGGSNAHP